MKFHNSYCEFCTKWTDGFQKDIPSKAVRDWLGQAICLRCINHIRDIFDAHVNKMAHEMTGRIEVHQSTELQET